MSTWASTGPKENKVVAPAKLAEDILLIILTPIGVACVNGKIFLEPNRPTEDWLGRGLKFL